MELAFQTGLSGAVTAASLQLILSFEPMTLRTMTSKSLVSQVFPAAE
jgi:hypothetical protein